jgi:hypothetical protein
MAKEFGMELGMTWGDLSRKRVLQEGIGVLQRRERHLLGKGRRQS